MISVVGEQTAELEQLCLHYNVLKLDLFGSAATSQYRPEESDLDFVVEFQPLPDGAYADTYFGLLEALERLFGKPVDLGGRFSHQEPVFPAIH